MSFEYDGSVPICLAGKVYSILCNSLAPKSFYQMPALDSSHEPEFKIWAGLGWFGLVWAGLGQFGSCKFSKLTTLTGPNGHAVYCTNRNSST